MKMNEGHAASIMSQKLIATLSHCLPQCCSFLKVRCEAILRGHKVLLDADLAALYGVETKVLLQSVKRNISRLPADFMLQLTAAEWLRLRPQFLTLKNGRGHHRKYL